MNADSSTLDIDLFRIQDEKWTPTIFNFKDADDFQKNCWRVCREIEINGFSILQFPNSEANTLKRVSLTFGSLQKHVRSDDEGIVDIKTAPQINNSDLPTPEVFKGLGVTEFLPHTDGSYLDGLIRQGDVLKRVAPPKMIALQSVSHGSGKDKVKNILVDAKEIFSNLLRFEPLHAKILLKPGCLSFCRDDQMALDFPLFENISDNCWRVRFRADEMTYVQHWAYLSVKTIQEKYILNSSYTKAITLEPGQILLIDNFRMLHGRGAIPSGNQGRHLRRTWIADETRNIITNFADKPSDHKVFEGYRHYQEIQPKENVQQFPLENFRLGIKLSGEQMLRLARLTGSSYE